MARRFEQYKVKRGDNLADPEFWNRRLEDIDLRIAAGENTNEKIDQAVEDLTSLTLRRLDDTLTPLIVEAQGLVADGRQFMLDAQAASADLVATAQAVVDQVEAALEAAQNIDIDGGTF
jgi:hypothetical protein